MQTVNQARVTLVACAVSSWLTGCTLGPDKTEEGLLEKAFDAIREGSWEGYSRWTITTSDFILKEQGMQGAFKEKQSFAGGVLKKEDKERARQDFQRAVAGGPGLIDFKKATFVGKGTLLHAGHEDTLSGGSIPVQVFSLRIKSDGKVVDTKDLGPHFVLTRWNGRFRVLRLGLPPAGP